MPNPFELAAAACASKKLTAKEYLMKVQGMSEDEANAYLVQISQE